MDVGKLVTHIGFVSLICIGIFGSLTFGVLMLNIIQNCYIYFNSGNVSIKITILNIITILAGFGMSVSDCIHVYLSNKYNVEWNTSTYYIRDIIYIADTFWLLSYVLLYITVYYRLYVTFTNTKYQISRICHSMFWTLTLTTSVSMVLSMYGSYDNNPKLGLDAFFGLMVCDLVISLLLLGLFIVNIKHIVSSFDNKFKSNNNYLTQTLTSTTANTQPSINLYNNDSESSAKVSNNDISKLEFIMIRQTVLGIISMLITQLTLIFDTLMAMITIQSDLIFIFYIVRSFNAFIISINLLLSFNINVNIYNHLCCMCHNICKFCCFM